MTQQFRAKVGGWMYPRLVVLEKGQVTMEVARISCSHCPTCSGRINYVQNRLNGEGKLAYQGGGVLVTLPYPADRGRSQIKVTEFLGEKMGLQIWPV